jgi:CRP-like cAMP-binding protein
MLSSVPIFSSLKKRHLKAIASSGKQLSYRTGTKIVSEGEMGVGFYLILDGNVEVTKGGKRLARLGRGQFFGEMALLDNKPRSADVVATEEVTCFALSSWTFLGIVKTYPEIAVSMMKELASRLRETNRALTE